MQDSNQAPQKVEVQMVEIEFKYTDCNLDLKTTVPLKEMFSIMHTGLLRNKAVSQVTVFMIENTSVVYSIVDAKSGKNPWLEINLQAT
jgi:hypothetical protein